VARFLSFAWAGVVLGLASLRIVHQLVAERAGRLAGATVVLAAPRPAASASPSAASPAQQLEAVTHPVAVTAEAVRLGGSEPGRSPSARSSRCSCW